jgi:hypothetical protein
MLHVHGKGLLVSLECVLQEFQSILEGLALGAYDMLSLASEL